MNQMNQIIVEGNVVRDSLVKQTPRGTKVCVVPIATNHFYKNASGELQKDVAYLDVEAWGQNFSETIVRNATKGKALRVVGRLKQDRWKSQDGKSNSKVYILAEHIDFQFPKSNGNSQTNEKNQAENAATGLRSESTALSFDTEEYVDGDEAVF
ncbi:MAG: single-stranded DNA-binding protein [Treponema sp.]|nr:single-stranded DNA-binding protein [Treponema sp.]